MNVERAQQLTDDGMTFDIMEVRQVRRGSPGSRAGFKVGDQIIAVDGQVFPTIAAFASYVGSKSPGSRINVDYMPSGGGPQQAERVAVVVGAPSGDAQTPAASGMSTGTKVAIGAGAVALLGCYELGCFSHHAATAPPNAGRQTVEQSNGRQQQR